MRSLNQWFMAFALGVFLSAPALAADTPRDGDGSGFKYNALVRALLLNDQRIQWSGLETTFSAEAVVNLSYLKKNARWQFLANGEFFINQPFNQNILSDEYRDRYRQNFDIDTFSFKQLFIEARTGAFAFKIGKFVTPFGRNFVPSFCNAFSDQPFIRSESIIRYDTGLMFSVNSGLMHLDLAFVNGSEDQDTNSAKTLIGRLGLGNEKWGIGVSGKYFGDRGSETQKQYSDHLGMDIMLTSGAFTLTGELITEHYGLNKPFVEDEIFWPRSFYYRDIYYQYKTPIHGSGGYLNLLWKSRNVSINLNYGQYYPQQIGNPLHDAKNNRLLVSCTWQLAEGLNAFVSTLIENDRPREPVFSGASPYMFLMGVHYVLRPAD